MGLGADLFLFSAAKGQRVTAADFDAVGGGDQQDYIHLFDLTYKAFERGNDLWLKLDGRGTVVLTDVNFPDFDINDL